MSTVSTLMKSKREQLAKKYAREIHWNTNRNPDIYEQEAQHRTTKLILRAFAEIVPVKSPVRIL